MSFKTLENRFTENVNKLYAGATYKFENGKPSTGRNDDPLIVRKPGDGYWNFAESRSTPISSTLVDVKRLTLFSLSKRGILFLAKQQLLQTGNTFEHTRIINPAFVLANAVPFVHVKRNLRPIAIGGPVGRVLSFLGIKKDTGNNSVTELRKSSQLQQETYGKVFDRVSTNYPTVNKPSLPSVRSLIRRIPVIGQTVSAATAPRSMGEVDDKQYSRPELKQNNYIGYLQISKENKEDKQPSSFSFSPQATLQQQFKVTVSTNPIMDASPGAVLTNTFGMFNNVFSTRPTTGPVGASMKKRKIKYGAVENSDDYITYLSELGLKNTPLTTDYKRYIFNQYNKSGRYKAVLPSLNEQSDKLEYNYTGIASIELDKKIKKYIENQDSDIKTGNTITYIKYFNPKDSLRSLSVDAIIEGKNSNPQTLADGIRERTKTKKISYIRDASNDIREEKSPGVAQEAYSRIATNFKDPVIVSFAMGPDNRTTQGQGHIRFRAFIKDLIETTTPNYTPLQYIGRMERFNYYTGVERKISFRLGLLSFSEDELDGMWRRLNFLTGMAYPYGFNRGIFQPNNIRLTIGNVYVNQPGYIQSINTDFAGITETWEITPGKQVPISAMVTMDFVLIEKASRLADSPFYGINEEKVGFSTQIPTATQQNDSRNSAPTVADPALSSTTVPVNSVRPPANPSNAANILNTVRNQVGFMSNALVTNSSLANPFARNP